MRLAFLDDSEQTDPIREGLGHLRALGTVIFPEAQVAGYADDLAGIRAEIGIPAGEEIKWKPAKGSFLARAGGEAVTALRRRMLEAAIAREARSIVVIIDHSAVYTSRGAAEVGQELLKWLFERLSMHLSDHGDLGIVVADKPGGGSKEEKKWLADTLRLTNDGTEYVPPGQVVLPIVTADSQHVPHLQLADLITAATTAAIAGRKSALDLGPLLAKLMHRHRLDAVNGAGLVLFPEKYNLLFWCFGETSWAKPSAQTGWALPHPDWAYGTSDGLAP
ncbi:hypothetical protein Ade02nite_24840 [Paractinoplanes deccanensis]|uniref:DUF3800 domain-containing protein n=1 Tax=Paractinoplanes deccanensis TaxID=113561 RepID=A0ABQ3Y1H7_9ACTN|nr:DUF3800 domain-containing protein [Actinoplanes deccanensis]GID73843.1 hypothetical protein Ade02nite_24840 [Actinoplanes deccanensis]